jgi:type I restriction enzyme R subunit
LPTCGTKLEELNDYTFTDTEWERFFADCIANKNDGIVEKTRKIQEDYVQVLKRDDGHDQKHHAH